MQDVPAFALLIGTGGYCGGVLVHPRLILTAAHCVQPFEVRFPNAPGVTPPAVAEMVRWRRPAEITDARDYMDDLALAVLSEPVPCDAIEPVAIGALPAEGERVRAIGAGAPNPGELRGTSAAVLGYASGAHQVLIRSESGRLLPGDSGSPLLDARGAVLGVVSIVPQLEMDGQLSVNPDRIGIYTAVAEYLPDLQCAVRQLEAGQAISDCLTTERCPSGTVRAGNGSCVCPDGSAPVGVRPWMVRSASGTGEYEIRVAECAAPVEYHLHCSTASWVSSADSTCSDAPPLETRASVSRRALGSFSTTPRYQRARTQYSCTTDDATRRPCPPERLVPPVSALLATVDGTVEEDSDARAPGIRSDLEIRGGDVPAECTLLRADNELVDCLTAEGLIARAVAAGPVRLDRRDPDDTCDPPPDAGGAQAAWCRTVPPSATGTPLPAPGGTTCRFERGARLFYREDAGSGLYAPYGLDGFVIRPTDVVGFEWQGGSQPGSPGTCPTDCFPAPFVGSVDGIVSDAAVVTINGTPLRTGDGRAVTVMTIHQRITWSCGGWCATVPTQNEPFTTRGQFWFEPLP